MNKKNLCLLLLLLFMIGNTQLYAWGTTGHRVIAEIAERNLNRKAKKKIKKLLDGNPMAYWANWPDEIKSDSTRTWKNTFQWHYVNFPSGLSFEKFMPELEHYKTENIYSAINENLKKAGDKSLPVEDRKIALCFLIHLMGDLEQPLHIGREEDLGGNKIKVMWFSKETNLHSVWDSQLIDYYKYSYTEYASVLNVYSKKENEKLAEGNLENWLFDSYQLAGKIYSEIGNYKTLDYQYAYYNKKLLEDQLLKGGLRLAKVLNGLFG